MGGLGRKEEEWTRRITFVRGRDGARPHVTQSLKGVGSAVIKDWSGKVGVEEEQKRLMEKLISSSSQIPVPE